MLEHPSLQLVCDQNHQFPLCRSKAIMQPYKNTGPVDCTVKPDLSQLKGKSVIITGGASGLGEGYVRAFTKAGAYVTFGDISAASGQTIADEVGAQFVKCDVTQWDEQVQLFRLAKANSPHHSVDVVIANAGVGGLDALWTLDDPAAEPVKPDLKPLNVDLIGVLYTFKLAVHYFRAQPDTPDRDRCFVFKGSLGGILDLLGNWQYSVSKFGLRGLMRTVRRSSHAQDIRVNYVAPYYVKSNIRNVEVQRHLEGKGVEFAHGEDCDAAMLRIACDRGIHGRSFAIVPRGDFAHGYIDADQDDWDEGEYLQKLQATVVRAFVKEWKLGSVGVASKDSAQY